MTTPQTPESHGTADNQVEGALGPILDNPVLGLLAETLDDIEHMRCAAENRLRTLTDTSDRGFGLDLRHPDVANLAATVTTLQDLEHQAILNLQRAMRKHPLWTWAKPIRGLGEKQFARLLASIGDPYWNHLHDRPRKLSELRAYCGFHVLHPGGKAQADDQSTNAAGVAPKRQRGQQANWNDAARKRAWLIATSCVKQPKGTRYRDIYDTTRAKYADAVHHTECVRCGPSGKPAQPGSPLSLGHQHARGLRAVAAKADQGDELATLVCSSLDQQPTVANVGAILNDLVRFGASPQQAAQVLVISVTQYCTRNVPVVQAFIDTYAPSAANRKQVGGKVS